MINYHCINVKMTWVLSAAALDRGKMPALQNPALTFWTVTAVESWKTARTKSYEIVFVVVLLLFLIQFYNLIIWMKIA